jgi:site-specific recombinase XerD
MQRALKLQGKAKATKEAYSRAVRRSAEYFERCPDDLSAEELRAYFASLLETHSWSTIKLDRCGLQFFYRHVLERPWDWVEIVKPPQMQRLPDVLTREQTHRLLGAVYKLRYRVFFVTLYSTGLRLSEGLALQVGDIDGQGSVCADYPAAVGRAAQVVEDAREPVLALPEPQRRCAAHAQGRYGDARRRGSSSNARGGGRL